MTISATDLQLYELLGNKELSFGCVVQTIHEHSKKNKWKPVKFAFIPEGRDTTPTEDAKLLSNGKFYGSIKCVNDDGFIEQLDCARWGDLSKWEKWERYNDNIRIIGHEPTFEDLCRKVATMNGFKSFKYTWKSIDIEVIVSSGDIDTIWMDYDLSVPLIKQSDGVKLQIINVLSTSR